MIINLACNEVLATQVRVCNNSWTRLRGLLGTQRIAPNEACWIKPCRSVHTVGMKYPLDVYFLNKQGKVIACEKNLKPNRITRYVSKAHSVLEFSAGERACSIGDELRFDMPGLKIKGLGQKGAAMVELALTIIIFMVFMLGFCEFFRVCKAWATIQVAVNEAGRSALIGFNPGAGLTREEVVEDFVRDKAAELGEVVSTVQYLDNDGDVLVDTAQPGIFWHIRAQAVLVPNPAALAIFNAVGFANMYTVTGQTMVRNEPF